MLRKMRYKAKLNQRNANENLERGRPENCQQDFCHNLATKSNVSLTSAYLMVGDVFSHDLRDKVLYT